jgi:hypothetical protein
MAPGRLIPILSVLVALTAVVAGAVVWSQRQTKMVHSAIITRPAPELGPQGFQLLPNLDRAVMVVPDRPHDPQEVRSLDRDQRIKRVRRFEVSTNSQGYRGPELVEPAPHPRIVCVGDSVTFGWGVSAEESYPARLAALLGVDVINAGVPANKPDHMGAWLSSHAEALDPDVILFTARPNHTRRDPYGQYARALAQAAATGAKVGVVLPPISTFDAMGSRSQPKELRRVLEIAAKVPGGAVPVLELTESFRAALPLPGYIMEHRNGRQVVLKLPERTVFLDVEAPARGLAAEVVAAFEADPTFAEPLFYDGGHPDAAGFGIFAAVVATWTQQHLL